MFFFARSPSGLHAARAALVHGAGLALLLQAHGCAGVTPRRSACVAWSCGGASNDELVDKLRNEAKVIS